LSQTLKNASLSKFAGWVISCQFSGSSPVTLYKFPEIVITPYDEHLQNLNEICQEMA